MIENTGLHDRKTGAKKSNYKKKYFRDWENKFENSKCQLMAIPYNRKPDTIQNLRGKLD